MPTEANLLDAYASFAELQTACARFTEAVNSRAHRVTRRPPVEMLAEQAHRLHRLPAAAFTAAFGVTRTIAENTPSIWFDHAQYSMPHRLAGQTVRVRRHGKQVVITHVDDAGAVEVARHQITHPGRPTGRQHVLAGAALWLTEAVATGATRSEPRSLRRSSWPGCTATPCGPGRSGRPAPRPGWPHCTGAASRPVRITPWPRSPPAHHIPAVTMKR